MLNKNEKANLVHFLVSLNFDIWLLNIRGNKYSCKHSHLDEEGTEYWDFSFHEVGIYDVPTAVNEVFNRT